MHALRALPDEVAEAESWTASGFRWFQEVSAVKNTAEALDAA